MMSKVIDTNLPVFHLCTEFPEIIPIMRELGFEQITNANMLKTAGRIMTLTNGCRMKGISLNTVIAALENNGFTIK